MAVSRPDPAPPREQLPVAMREIRSCHSSSSTSAHAATTAQNRCRVHGQLRPAWSPACIYGFNDIFGHGFNTKLGSAWLVYKDIL
ncbi:hypothetical protein EJB05_51895, partial [Eragrostis curvula]